MFQLQILTGSRRGALVRAGRLPMVLGRGDGVQLRLEDAGVWDRHLEFTLHGRDGVHASVLGQALCSLNDEPFTTGRLRNGDSLKLGSVALRFWLAEARQRSPAASERLVWTALIVFAFVQAAFLVWLGG